MAKNKFKWDDASATQARSMYEQQGNDGLDEIAAALSTDEVQVTRRSVIAKLTNMGVYQKPEKPAPQPKDEGPTKAEIMSAIKASGFDTEGFQGATKDALNRLAETLGVEVE